MLQIRQVKNDYFKMYLCKRKIYLIVALVVTLKACTHTHILGGTTLEFAQKTIDSMLKSVNSFFSQETAHAILNMFDIYLPIA